MYLNNDERNDEYDYHGGWNIDFVVRIQTA